MRCIYFAAIAGLVKSLHTSTNLLLMIENGYSYVLSQEGTPR